MTRGDCTPVPSQNDLLCPLRRPVPGSGEPSPPANRVGDVNYRTCLPSPKQSCGSQCASEARLCVGQLRTFGLSLTGGVQGRGDSKDSSATAAALPRCVCTHACTGACLCAPGWDMALAVSVPGCSPLRAQPPVESWAASPQYLCPVAPAPGFTAPSWSRAVEGRGVRHTLVLGTPCASPQSRLAPGAIGVSSPLPPAPALAPNTQFSPHICTPPAPCHAAYPHSQH